jgi:hypothetical protein
MCVLQEVGRNYKTRNHLHVYWVVHNFLRAHFTTREVPAVALGVLERRLSVREVALVPFNVMRS